MPFRYALVLLIPQRQLPRALSLTGTLTATARYVVSFPTESAVSYSYRELRFRLPALARDPKFSYIVHAVVTRRSGVRANSMYHRAPPQGWSLDLWLNPRASTSLSERRLDRGY